jgi:hypothetical protein
MSIIIKDTKILDSITANTNSGAIDVEDFETVVLSIITTGTVLATVKVKGSIAATAPNYASASSLLNPYSYIGIKDYNTGSIVTGSTGITISTASVVLVELNVNGLTNIGVEVSGMTGGTVSVFATRFKRN